MGEIGILDVSFAILIVLIGFPVSGYGSLMMKRRMYQMSVFKMNQIFVEYFAFIARVFILLAFALIGFKVSGVNT